MGDDGFRLRLEARPRLGLVLRALPKSGPLDCPRCGAPFARHRLARVGRHRTLMGSRGDADPYPCLVFRERERRGSKVRSARS